MAACPCQGRQSSSRADRSPCEFSPSAAPARAQTTFVNAGGKLHVEPLLDRLEEIHHEMVCDVVAAEREHVLVFAPLTFHELRCEPFLLEESQLNRAEDRRLARS